MNAEQFISWLARQSQRPFVCYSEKPLIMGILNVTPDSFTDGGKFLSVNKAGEQALHLISQGADLIDMGGESTQPGAKPVPVEVELNRVIPVIEYIRTYSDVCISIDTNKPEVMVAAVKAGANVINDIYALRAEGALEVAAKLGVPVCLMHMQGTPQTMQHDPYYPDGVYKAVQQFFIERIEACLHVGIEKHHLILDPGFGFGKRVQDNLYLINMLTRFTEFEVPLLLGVSRKSTIGAVLNQKVDGRLIGSVALAVYAALNGVGIIRAHDVDETSQALKMIDMVHQAKEFNN